TPRLTANDPLAGAGMLANFLYTQAEIIQSPAIMSRVASRPEIHELKSLRGVTDAVRFIGGSVHATPGRRDDTITVSAMSTEREDAAAIANAVVEEYKAFQLSQRKQSSVDLATLYQKSLDDRERELRGQYQKRVEFQSQNPSFTIGTDRANAVLERLNQL